jgi:hypothetical protein
MSESVQRDDHRSSFHDMLHFRYDEHRPALHVEGLMTARLVEYVAGIAYLQEVYDNPKGNTRKLYAF